MTDRLPAASAGMEIRVYRPEDRDAVVALWRDTGLTIPANDPDRDIAFCMASGHGRVFVGHAGGAVVATAMAGHEGHRGWLYYVATHPDHRGRGYGRQIVAHAEAWLASLGVPKLNLMIRPHNTAVQAFYETLGYAVEPRVNMARRLDSTAPATVEVTTTWLEMRAQPLLMPIAPAAKPLAVLRAQTIPVPFYRYLYNRVGERWLWYQRRGMSDAALAALLHDPGREITVLYWGGVPAGFAEFDLRTPGEIEILLFGLMPEAIGLRLGPYFLKWILDDAWSRKPERVWLHTCTHDHPKALGLYQRMGFVPYRQETHTVADPRPLMV